MNNFIVYIMTILVLFVILRVLSMPFKSIIKIVINSILGGVLIYALNILGEPYALNISLNAVSSIFIGLTGLPGVLTLILLTRYITFI